MTAIAKYCALISYCTVVLLVNAWPKIFKVLNLRVFTVGNFRQEDSVEALSIKVLFVARVLEIVLTRPRVLLAR